MPLAGRWLADNQVEDTRPGNLMPVVDIVPALQVAAGNRPAVKAETAGGFAGRRAEVGRLPVVKIPPVELHRPTLLLPAMNL